MKKYLSRTKVFVLIAIITLITTTVAASVLKVKLKDDDKVQLNYVGNVNKLPVYRLSLKNNAEAVYFVSISDKSGNVFYCDQVEGVNIVRNYQLDNEVYSNEYELTFTVTDLNGKTVGTYNVTRNQKVVDEISVDEVK
ncbi:hypothetical protein GCM10027051_06520 [Niabella terrae]